MRLALAAATFGGGVLQSSVVPLLAVAGTLPDVPLILTAFVALRRGPEAGAVVGFFAGLLQDLAAGGLVGVQALTKAVAGFALGLAGSRLWVASPLVQVPALVVVTAAEGLLRFGLLRIFHYPAELAPLLRDVILPQALYNGALGAAGLVAAGLVEAARARLVWR